MDLSGVCYWLLAFQKAQKAKRTLLDGEDCEQTPILKFAYNTGLSLSSIL